MIASKEDLEIQKHQFEINEKHQRHLEALQREKYETMTEEEKCSQKEAEHFSDIINAYNHYGTHSFQHFSQKEADFKRLIPRYQKLIPSFLPRMEDIRAAIIKNQFFVRQITANTEIFMNGQSQNVVRRQKAENPSEFNLDKVRSTLRQCSRDWSSEGEKERSLCYGPILKEICERFPNESERHNLRILNPGCGLGRLTWEIAYLGFQSQGNEFSYFMLLASNMILNRSQKDQHVLHPFIHECTNVRSSSDQLRSVTVPDVNTYSLPSSCKFSMAAGDFLDVYGSPDHFGQWDAVASCFFLDTAHNVLQYFECIARILKPGGFLINLGPLLFHYTDMPRELSIEISYEEMRLTFEHFGLKIVKEEFDKQSTYCQNQKSMLRMSYNCVFFVAVRVPNAPIDSIEYIPFCEEIRQGGVTKAIQNEDIHDHHNQSEHSQLDRIDDSDDRYELDHNLSSCDRNSKRHSPSRHIEDESHDNSNHREHTVEHEDIRDHNN